MLCSVISSWTISWFFKACLKNRKKDLLTSSCLSAWKQLGSHWMDFHEI